MNNLACKIWLVVLTLGFHPAASAHSLNIFSYREGSSIQGSVYFSGGGAAKEMPVQLLDSMGTPISTALTNPDGQFIFPNATSADVQLIVETPDGHRADFLLEGTPEIETAEQLPTPESGKLPFVFRMAIGWTAIALLGLFAFWVSKKRRPRP